MWISEFVLLKEPLKGYVAIQSMSFAFPQVNFSNPCKIKLYPQCYSHGTGKHLPRVYHRATILLRDWKFWLRYQVYFLWSFQFQRLWYWFSVFWASFSKLYLAMRWKRLRNFRQLKKWLLRVCQVSIIFFVFRKTFQVLKIWPYARWYWRFVHRIL